MNDLPPKPCPKATCTGQMQLIGTGQLSGGTVHYWECTRCRHYTDEQIPQHDELTLDI